ncbi:ROK family transcriptional regulator [Streptomyces sp. ODS05-4]|uniref:ROK family transcriptional regulator n=1 Tax=Streptomyces sp. ODS05-4 TaxID=2944939 RepID=UPI002109AD89|nr:ROK family transcriptional regulator [Streptomyces sp. ODS05-4]
MAARNRRTVGDLRRSNRAAVLRRLYFDGPTSRQELGPATGLSSGTISNVVGDLVGDGLLEEAGTVDSDGGRPRTLLRIVPGAGRLIGVDVGETRVRVELFDLALTELARVEKPMTGPAAYDVDTVVARVRDGIAEVLRHDGDPAGEYGPDGGHLVGVGVGVPGIVAATPGQGAVVHGQTIGWDAVPLERLLRTACRLPDTVPVLIENGARTLGQAEMWFGAGRGAQSATVVLFGSGVGACLVTDHADQGRALEWGHVTVRVGGRRCRCGAPGCLEAYAGAAALLERWREAGGRPPRDADEETALAALIAAAYPAEGPGSAPGAGAAGGVSGAGSTGGGPGAGTAESAGSGPGAETAGSGPGAAAGSPEAGSPGSESPDVGTRGPGGAGVGPGAGGGPRVEGAAVDPVAAAVLAETAEYLGAGLSGLINLFQPERVLIGGWAGLLLGPRFLDEVRRHAAAYSMSYPAGRAVIALGALGPDAVTVGAATLPLGVFLDAGGRREEPVREMVLPVWQTAIQGRVLN